MQTKRIIHKSTDMMLLHILATPKMTLFAAQKLYGIE